MRQLPSNTPLLHTRTMYQRPSSPTTPRLSHYGLPKTTFNYYSHSLCRHHHSLKTSSHYQLSLYTIRTPKVIPSPSQHHKQRSTIHGVTTLIHHHQLYPEHFVVKLVIHSAIITIPPFEQSHTNASPQTMHLHYYSQLPASPLTRPSLKSHLQ